MYLYSYVRSYYRESSAEESISNSLCLKSWENLRYGQLFFSDRSLGGKVQEDIRELILPQMIPNSYTVFLYQLSACQD